MSGDGAVWVNSLGLILDIVGATLLWKYGLPAKLDRDGTQHFALEQADEGERQRAERYDKFSSMGLGFLIVGFALQLLSNLL